MQFFLQFRICHNLLVFMPSLDLQNGRSDTNIIFNTSEEVATTCYQKRKCDQHLLLDWSKNLPTAIFYPALSGILHCASLRNTLYLALHCTVFGTALHCT